MTRGPIDLMGEALGRARGPAVASTGGRDEATVPWTFNQVLQPIILVLTFVILTQIHVYRQQMEGYKRSHERMRKAVRALIASPEGAKDAERLAAIHNTQRYKLLFALEQVKAERRNSWRASLFPDAHRIRRTGTMLDDDRFREFCLITIKLSQEAGLAEEALAIYREVLKRAEISDPGDRGEPLKRSQIPVGELTPKSLGELSGEELDDVVQTQPGVISNANRRLACNAILDFCHGIGEHAVSVQSDLISGLWRAVLEDPGQLVLTDESRKIAERMLHPDLAEGDRQAEARKLHRSLVEEWRNALEKGNYPMLIWGPLRDAM